jgi:hypothetical protein
MTNKDFASVLAIAVENKKQNESQLVKNFIATHNGDAKTDPILDPTEPTKEMVAFANEFRKKRAKTKDKNLDDFLTKIIDSAPAPKATAPKAENHSYRAQEH